MKTLRKRAVSELSDGLQPVAVRASPKPAAKPQAAPVDEKQDWTACKLTVESGEKRHG